MTFNDMYLHFREVARHLWNHGFHSLPELRHWECQAEYQRIVEQLFRVMMIIPSGIDTDVRFPWPDDQDIQVDVTPVSHTVRIWLDERVPSDSVHIYAHDRVEVGHGIKLQLLEPFDWDQLGIRDFEYLRVMIRDWPSHPDKVGLCALINATDASLKLTTKGGDQLPKGSFLTLEE